MMKILLVFLFLGKGIAWGSSTIDIIDALIQLMPSKNEDFSLRDPLTVSDAFEGCIFQPYELSEGEKRSNKSIVDTEFHFQTKCALTYGSEYLSYKNLSRDYRMKLSMHGSRSRIDVLEINATYPNHLSHILNDPKIQWTPLRCEKKESLSDWERWYLVSTKNKSSLYAHLSFSSGSGGTWENLVLFWEKPKELPTLDDTYTDKCPSLKDERINKLVVKVPTKN